MDYSYIRENFNINTISKSILSIQITLDGFSFVVCPAESDQNPDYIHINRLENPSPENLKAAFSGFREFDFKEFFSVFIMVHTGFFALVPETIFDPADMTAYLDLNHTQRNTGFALSNRIPDLGAVSIFSMDHEIYGLLKNKFPTAGFCHTSLPFCNVALAHEIDGCFVQCYEKSIELAIVQGHKLILYNIFNFQDGNDIVYFILNAYKSINLDPLFYPLFIAGTLKEGSEVIKLTEKYIKNIRSCTTEPYFIPETGDFHYPSHYFTNHRGILNCEL